MLWLSNKTDDLQSAFPPFACRLWFYPKLTFTRKEVVASAVTKLIEAVERRREIEQQMETLVNQVTAATEALEEMMRIGIKGREDDVKKQNN